MTITNTNKENNTRVTGDFKEFSELLKKTFLRNVGTQPVFTTKLSGDNGKVCDDSLWQTYLSSFSEEDGQEFKCSCCKDFLRKYGDLVIIKDNGLSVSAIWDTSEDFGYYNKTVAALAKLVDNQAASRVFLANTKVIGTAVAGGWSHFHLELPEHLVCSGFIKAHQVVAEKKQDYIMVSRGLSKYKEPVVTQALKLLKTDSLYRSEKVLAPVQWLKDLHTATVSSLVRNNTVWLAVAKAPKGFAHVNSNMASTLMDDIVNGLSFEVLSKRFATKMQPYNYLRPKAAPSNNNIEQAEKIIAEKGIALSLERRHAKLEDLELLWSPVDEVLSEGICKGVFGHLKNNTQEVKDVDMTPIAITWYKFNKVVLPTAEKLQVIAPNTGDYCAYVTATHEDAPNILQWANTVSNYLYTGGSPASRWGIQSNTYIDVTGLSLRPNQWVNAKGLPNQGEGVLFVLDGCRDSNDAGLALFPEILSSDLHSIRKTIELFSSKGKLTGVEDSSASGLMFNEGSPPITVKVFIGGLATKYKIDRWD
tara:strand:- start:60 stop:1658 length:1599 start_codon:yes stop_codon:yes gene_type:complete